MVTRVIADVLAVSALPQKKRDFINDLQENVPVV
jgi:hypothetical protein